MPPHSRSRRTAHPAPSGRRTARPHAPSPLPRKGTPPARRLARPSWPAPLFAQLGPIVQALPDLALEATLGRVVECLAAERLGEIVLAREGIGRVVVVIVAFAVAFRLHQPGRSIEDVLG